MAAGAFVSLPNSSVIDTTKQVTMFEGYQKCFVTNVSLLYVADFTNTLVSTANIVPGGVGTEFPTKGTVLTGATSSATGIVDYIDATSGAAKVYMYTTSGTWSSGEVVANAAASVSFTLAAGATARPHFYPWTVYGNSSNYGSMPEFASIGTLYRGRCVLAGNIKYPYQWYVTPSKSLGLSVHCQ